MPISIDGSGSITGISTGGLEDGIITPAELSTGGPSWDASGSLQVNSINNGPLAGMRNAIINGNFDIWQRGTSGSAPNYAAADRWVNAISGSGCTMSRQSFTPGQTAVPGEPTYFCRMDVTSVAGAGNLAILLQRIEDVRTFAGQQIAVSFWAKADSSKPIAAELIQYFGTGGSPSAEVNALGVTKTTLSTNWQKVIVTTTLPSISGKTLGSAGDHFLTLAIWLDAGSNFNARTDSLGQQSGTFDIAQVQVEAGPVATPFERRPIGTELALCQRYYEQGSYRLVWGAYATNAFLGHSISFNTAKRISGVTVSLTSLETSTSSAATLTSANSGGFLLQASSTGTNIGCVSAGNWTASAEL